ncbi:MAG: hypothetical protein EOM87_07935 [Clostridia bacterium]|nr:hypothetical protein [Clostridia bacterium]
MGSYDSRDKKRAIKYIYKEDTTKKDSIAKAQAAYKQECEALNNIKSQLAGLKKQMESVKYEYRFALEQKIDSLSGDMKNAKEEGKRIDSELDTLKQS